MCPNAHMDVFVSKNFPGVIYPRLGSRRTPSASTPARPGTPDVRTSMRKEAPRT